MTFLWLASYIWESTATTMTATNLVPAALRSTGPDGRLTMRFSRRFNRVHFVGLAPGALASIAVLFSTWICFRLGLNLASVGFLYLVCVVLAAVHGGFWQATWVSVISVACLDYFFDDPIFSFSVVRVSNWVELGAFEFTALIISQLSTRAHLRELEAIAERRETERLYQTARRILLFDRADDPGHLVTTLIREIFALDAVFLFDAPSSKVYKSGRMPGTDDAARISQTRAAYLQDSETYDPSNQSWFCALRLGVRPMGSLALCGAPLSQLTATALASLAAIALEQSRALNNQYHAEAARQAEQLRSAVLDSMAHQFKTPLTVIRTASSGLPASGGLTRLQTELVSLIDQEARKLSDLASRLVGAPELHPTGFAPQPEPLLLSRLMKTAIQELQQQGDRDRFQIAAPAHEPPVFADRELILTALAQLIDNAIKYSIPDSPIDVGLVVKEAAVVLTVRSKGLVVAAADRERIFERFYRASDAQGRSSGTGLGLSIVKTIAADHEGHVWADGEPGYGTVFSLYLPCMPGGCTS
jgi:two-component system sensor histidine kinase KdpD